MRAHPGHRRTTRAAAAAVAAAAWLAVSGCFNPFRPLIGEGGSTAEPPPRPTSPQNLVKLFQWCWVNRSIAEYEELFTENFTFAFTDVDAADNPPILRDEEVDIARRIFVDGSADRPRAKRIELQFSSALIAIPDSRPGKTDPWHKEITTRVTLRAELTDETLTVDGDVTFYLVRGDSALIPTELVERGFGPDAGRWYMERWEDKTNAGGGGAAAAPAPASPLRVMSALRAIEGAAAGTSLPARPGAPRVSPAPALRLTWGELMALFR